MFLSITRFCHEWNHADVIFIIVECWKPQEREYPDWSFWSVDTEKDEEYFYADGNFVEYVRDKEVKVRSTHL